MYLERLDINGFRNCSETVAFDPSLTLLIGENNAGKTNLIDALRLVLTPEAGTDRLRPRLSDFARDGGGNPLCDEFTIAVVMADLNIAEQGQLATALAPSTEGTGKARIGLYAQVRDADVAWHRFGGDHDRPDVETRALDIARQTYLPPLRDARADLQPGRTNRLARLLQVLTPDQPDRDRLVAIAQQSNVDLGNDPKIQQARSLVQSVLTEMTRIGHAQLSDIAFSDADFESLIRYLLARLGESSARDLAESGLGYQNLLYMAVLLAHLTEIDAVPLRVLLVEEPEAHLHPQLQDLLLRFLQNSSKETPGRQVIVTSNSPQFAAASDLERVVVVTRPRGVVTATAHPIRAFPMEAAEREHVRRFLDVTKASLFFARGVIFVEGVSEQLLLPQFARLLGRDLADSGVSIINLGGVAFRQFARLFGEDALPIRCAIISDGDPPGAKGPENPDNPDLTPNERAAALLGLRSNYVEVCLASVTLEWDMALAQPRDPLLIEIMTGLHPVSGAALAGEAELSASAWAFQFRDKLTRKAEFAQNLAAALDNNDELRVEVPDYLKRGIEHVTLAPAAVEAELPEPGPDSPDEDAIGNVS
jgi:putative ATP-dependent endonuclease of OLD family